jgi:HK97 family phage prohead protease
MSRTTATQFERRTFPLLEVKALDDAAGTFSGYLAVFDNVDQGGDVIRAGAFQKSLVDLQTKQRTRKSRYVLPIFWSHLPEEPLGGFVEASEDSHGLLVKGELDLDIEQGRRAYSGLKRGYLSGMSIGYITVKQGYEDGARVLKELRLLEGSLTALPMNEEAQVVTVKNHHQRGSVPPTGMRSDHKARDFATLFESLAHADDLQDEWGDTFIAFTHAISEVMWQQHAQVNGYLMPDAPTVDAQAATQSNLDAFSTALLDLVSRSVAADFTPSLDYDGDQFLDPDGCNAESESSGSTVSGDWDSLSQTPDETKAGRVMSTANHAEMGTALDGMGKSLDAAKAQYKALSDMHARFAPKTDDSEPSADGQDTQSASGKDGKSADATTGAGAGAAPTGALDGNTTPPAGDDTETLSESARARLVRLRTAMLTSQLQQPQKVSA